MSNIVLIKIIVGAVLTLGGGAILVYFHQQPTPKTSQQKAMQQSIHTFAIDPKAQVK